MLYRLLPCPSKIALFLVAIAFFLLTPLTTAKASPGMPPSLPYRVVALGDSLTSGYGLSPAQSFPEQLQGYLQREGYSVRVENAGVSGDTTAGGLSRLESAISGEQKPDLVIVALGANDMLRQLPEEDARVNIEKIIQKLQEKKIPVLLAGMKNPGLTTLVFRRSFGAFYEDLADEYDIPLYPYFLEGVALKGYLNQADGIHPNAQGVALVVEGVGPMVKDALKESREPDKKRGFSFFRLFE